MISPDDGDAQFMARNRAEIEGLEAEVDRLNRLIGELKKEILTAISYMKSAQLNNPTEAKMDMIRRLEELTAPEKRNCEWCGGTDSHASMCRNHERFNDSGKTSE